MSNVVISEVNEKFASVFGSLLKENMEYKDRYKEIFIRMSHLNTYSKEYKLKVMNEIESNGIDSFLEQKIVAVKDFQQYSLFPYPGNKIKFKDEMTQMFELAHNEDIETVVDTFLGAGGSISSLFEVFLEKGVKNLVLNDLNPTVLHTHKNIHSKKDEMIDTYIETFRTIHYLNDDIFNPSEETLLKLKEMFINSEQEELHSEVQTSVLFLFFQTLQFSGIYESETDKNGVRTSKINHKNYDINKYTNGLVNAVSKIEEYSMIYNSFNTKFRVEDYEVLVDKFKNDKTVLFLFDPPYYDAKANYGFNDFPQRKLLEKLSGLNFIYNNNKHPEIYEFITKYNFHSMDKLRRVALNNTDIPTYEYLVCSNNTNEQSVQLVVT